VKVDAANVILVLRERKIGFNSKELLTKLHQKASQKAHLRKVLRALAQEGYVLKNDSRYYLTEKGQEILIKGSPKPQAPLFNNQPTPKPQNKVKSSLDLARQGFFVADPPRILVQGEGVELPLSEDSERDFLPGDLLGFEPVGPSKTARITHFVSRNIEVVTGWTRVEENAVYIRPIPQGFDKDFKLTGLTPKAELDHKMGLARIISYPDPRASLYNLIDVAGEERRAIRAILERNEVPPHFTKGAQAEAESFGTEVTPPQDYTDLRDLGFVTIDGADAKDFDDAIYLETHPQGMRLLVSIADVSHYVRASSPLDKEAQRRGTSVYLPGRCIPMLPEALSNELCSLKAAQDRLTLTAEMLFDSKGNSLGFKVYPSVIKVRARLTYEQVEIFFQTGQNPVFDPATCDLLTLSRGFAQVLREKRNKRGAIDFSLPEPRFEWDKNGVLIGIHQSFQSEAMKLIEQFMLEANEQVGLFCTEQKLPVLWRNHPPPLPAKKEALKQLIWNLNLKPPPLETGMDYNLLLAQVQGQEMQPFIQIALLRSMSLAKYGNRRTGHFGLAAEYYLHFTSPIRRYPDLLVHRALHDHWANRPAAKLGAQLGDDASDREAAAKICERETNRLLQCNFMTAYLGQAFKAHISGFNRAGIYVEIAEPYVEGFMPFSAVPNERFFFDDQSNQVIAKRSNRKLRLGEKVQVILTKLDQERNELNFSWVAWDR